MTPEHCCKLAHTSQSAAHAVSLQLRRRPSLRSFTVAWARVRQPPASCDLTTSSSCAASALPLAATHHTPAALLPPAAVAPAPTSPSRMDPALLECRFYEQQFPAAEELVMVKVNSIQEMGAYVTLLEYNNCEGMIMLSELSRRRIRSINKLIRVGKNEVVMVIRVDKDKGYIDLSKRRVQPEDIAKCEEKFTKAKTVHSILRHVAERNTLPLEEVYQKIGWPLYKAFGNGFDAFKAAVADPDAVYAKLEGVPKSIWEDTLKNIRRRLAPQPLKIRSDVLLTCFRGEGIVAIQAALLKGMELSTEETPISIKLIAPPQYVMITNSLTKDAGIDVLNKAMEVVKAEIESRGGTYAVKMAPRVTSQRDETELQRLMEQLEKENAEVAGDDDASDAED